MPDSNQMVVADLDRSALLKIRGHHVGDYILHQSLCQLRKLGVETVNIDWTILKAFYGQFDFYAARTYRAAYMEL